MSNSNMDRNSLYNLSNFGRGMKNYAIAKIIWVIFMTILTFIIGSTLEDFTSMDEETMMENAGSIISTSIFVILGFIGGGIYLIVRYIGYIVKLNSASKTSIGNLLRTAFIFEILGLCANIITGFLEIPEIILVELAIVIISIAATIYLGKWVLSLSNIAVDEEKIKQMSSSILIMKIGLIVKLGLFLRIFSPTSMDSVGMIFSYIGNIILAVGMWKTGKVIKNLFSIFVDKDQSRNFTPQFQNPQVQQLSPEIGQYPIRSHISTEQTFKSKNLCPFCGSPILDHSSKFCAACGRNIK